MASNGNLQDRRIDDGFSKAIATERHHQQNSEGKKRINNNNTAQWEIQRYVYLVIGCVCVCV